MRHTPKGRWQKGQFLSQGTIPGGKNCCAKALWKYGTEELQINMWQRNSIPLRMFAVSCLFLRSTAQTASCQMIVLTSVIPHVEKLQIPGWNCSSLKAAGSSGRDWVMGWSKLGRKGTFSPHVAPKTGSNPGLWNTGEEWCLLCDLLSPWNNFCRTLYLSVPVALISVCPLIPSGGRHKLATGLIIKAAEH